MVCVSSYSRASHTRRWQTAGAARVGLGHGEGSRSSWRQTLGRQLCNSAWLNSVPDCQWNLTRSLLNMHQMDWSVCKYTHISKSCATEQSHVSNKHVPFMRGRCHSFPADQTGYPHDLMYRATEQWKTKRIMPVHVCCTHPLFARLIICA